MGDYMASARHHRLAGMFTALCCVVMIGVSTPSVAEIYKYKDANGNWQFTDKPPKEKGKPGAVGYGTKKRKVETRDVAASLKKRYKPQTVIEETTLAVVSVETSLGSGSGFFVSNDGYIVTNKHVVRPTEFKAWKESDEELEAAKARMKEVEQDLKRRKAKLKRLEGEVADYKKEVDRYNDREKKVAYAEIEVYEDRLKEMRKRYRKDEKWLKEKKRELSSAASDFNFKSASAKFSRQFKITFKDGKKTKASLVKLSKKHDLALLKLDGYITPRIDLKKPASVRQGMKVYAIGSPLGLKDFVTSGIITSRRSDSIYTDTQILPGNSGGPLVDTEGRILGVNTQKLSSTQSVGSEGFGISIPIKFVNDEFSKYLKKPVVDENKTEG